MSTAATRFSSPFSILSDDILLNIVEKLESDPRDWARLACVSARFSALIRHVCCRNKCFDSAPSVLSDLLSTAGDRPPGGWSAFHKLCVCCPGLLHSGVLLENSDFGLDRDIGSDQSYWHASSSSSSFSSKNTTVSSAAASAPPPHAPAAPSDCGWSLFDDLYSDAVYDASEVDAVAMHETETETGEGADDVGGLEFTNRQKERGDGTAGAHLADPAWNLSREQGNKLLARRFREDCLYLSDWPGCVHAEYKRSYKLFRGVFKNFKRSRVLRTINDGNRGKIDLECAFCECRETWDLHSAFCLRRVFGYHDDGEPVVRAFVCENGHVSGAWTD